MNVLFFKLTLALYFVGTLLFLVNLGGKHERMTRFSLSATTAGFLFHTLALGFGILETGQLPLTTFHGAMSFFSWALVLISVVAEFRYRMIVLGSFILPLAFLSLVSAAALPKEIRSLDRMFFDIWILLLLHVSLTILGFVAFTVAFVAGVLYLIQERLLKSKQLDTIHAQLPSLELLDGLNSRSILLGFPLLTLGMITGAVLSENIWDSYWGLEPVQTLTLIAWLFYLIMLHGRLTIGWRAKRAAYLAIFGFITVVLAVGVNFVSKGPHS
jgi:cytochrome c-type biogenesis protein CcsB